MAKEQLMMTATISSIQPGASPSAPSRVQTTDGQTLKVFAEKAAELAVGKTFQIPYYDKDYQGVPERIQVWDYQGSSAWKRRCDALRGPTWRS